MPEELYEELKNECPEHGQISLLVRQLLIKHLSKLKEE